MKCTSQKSRITFGECIGELWGRYYLIVVPVVPTEVLWLMFDLALLPNSRKISQTHDLLRQKRNQSDREVSILGFESLSLEK